MELEQLREEYRTRLNPLLNGDAEPFKLLWSHRDDVTLANPWGPAVHGWKQASERMDFAASRFRDGEITSVEPIAEYDTPDLVIIHQVEHWKAKVSGREFVDTGALRVTTIFRREDGDWKVILRHADPTTSYEPLAILRGTTGKPQRS